MKQNKLGFILNTANGEYIQDIYEDEEDSKAILESHLQDEPEEIFNCVELEEQKEYEQSIETQSNFKAELIYEEINIEAECEENSNQDGTIESETTICTNNNPVSVCKEADEMSKKIMSDFFLTVCNTVSTLPMLLQAKIKKQVFDIVSEAEISHLTEQLIHK